MPRSMRLAQAAALLFRQCRSGLGRRRRGTASGWCLLSFSILRGGRLSFLTTFRGLQGVNRRLHHGRGRIDERESIFRLPSVSVTSVGGFLASGLRFRVSFVWCEVPSWVITSSVSRVTGCLGSDQMLETRIVYLPLKPRGQT